MTSPLFIDSCNLTSQGQHGCFLKFSFYLHVYSLSRLKSIDFVYYVYQPYCEYCFWSQCFYIYFFLSLQAANHVSKMLCLLRQSCHNDWRFFCSNSLRTFKHEFLVFLDSIPTSMTASQVSSFSIILLAHHSLKF